MIKKFFLLISLTFFASLLHAELKTGDAFPAFTVQDQHEVEYTLEPGVRYLLVSFSMPMGKAANKYLEQKGQEFLDGNNAVYLADIHGMPWIGRKFALPKMKKYPHRILLGDSDDLLTDYPQEDDRLTVFKFGEDLTIESIHFWDPKSGDSPFSE